MSQPYLSLEAELHDAFWAAEDDGSELRLMAGFLKSHPGPALETGSGSGRLMFPLVQQGFTVEGLELSGDMIKLGRARAAKLAVDPVVHQGDMSTWQPPARYRSLLAPAFTLQLSSDPEATLRHWRGMLEPGGALYLTVFIPYAEILGELPPDQWYPDHRATLPDGRLGELHTRHQIDRDARILRRQHRYTIAGDPPVQHDSQQTIRWFEHHDLLAMLARNGFETESHLLDFDPETAGRPPDPEDSDGIITYLAQLA